MLTAELILALRTLRRRARYALTNSFGLTLGLACALLVTLYLGHELSYDTFHPDADRVVRLWKEIEGRDDRYVLDAPQRGPAYQKRVPGIEAVTAFSPNFGTTFTTIEDPGADGALRERRLKQEARTVFALKAGDRFFDVLGGFALTQGDPEIALARPDRAVLSEAAARRYFGADHGTILGRTIRLEGRTLTVSGLMRVPAASHFQPDVLHTYAEHTTTNSTHYTYFKLAEGTDRAGLPAQLDRVYASMYAETGRGFPPERLSNGLELLTDIHLETTAARPLTPPTDVRYLWGFGALGVIVLLIASVNYTNLAVAMGTDRGAEMGVRKALGARPGQVTRQLLVEAVVLTGLCAPLAVGVVAAVRPGFNVLMGTSLASPHTTPWVWGAVSALALVVGLGAGAYPAFGLAGKQATTLFDGSAFARTRGWGARQSLLVMQFGLMIALVIGAVLVQQQLQFIQTKDLGFERAQVLQITNGNALAEQDDDGNWMAPKFNELRRRLLQRPDIEGVTTLSRTPGEFWYEQTFSPAGDTTRTVAAPVLQADHYVFETLGIDPAGGPYFDRAPEERTGRSVLLSRAFIEALPADALNADGRLEALVRTDGGEPVPVDGVFESINFFSLKQEASPLVIVPRETVAYPPRILVRTAPGELQSGLRAIQDAWADLAPATPLSYTFLDDQVAALYEQERRFGTLSLALAGIAGLLAVLGLVSVAAYATRLRVKEVGIRKALGASIPNILVLLNREFVMLVGIALAVGAPLAWWAADAWLSSFAYRISVSPLVFLGVGLGALVLAVAAVSTQAVRTAQVDPATVLRSE